jgi:prepilin-type processing-associated H-X9-DG protein
VTISITEASPQQAALVHGIMQTAFSEYLGQLNPASPCHTETVGDVAKAIHNGGAIIAWVDGEAVGSARYSLSNDTFYVGRVSVLPEFRGCGVASAMMHYLDDLAGGHGYAELELCSRLNLPRNIALYERMGYEIASQYQLAPDADIQVTMRKHLNTLVPELA